MVRCLIFPALAIGLGLLGSPTLSAETEVSRRLFDFTPNSSDNPAIATIDGVAIPVSELRAYRAAERQQTVPADATVDQKRALLNDLIDQHLFVADAYAHGVDRSDGFVRQMEATRTMMLTDFLSAEVYQQTGDVARAGRDPVQRLGEQLFDAATIDISNEAYAVLKRLAEALNAPAASFQKLGLPASEMDSSGRLKFLIATIPAMELAHYEGKSLPLRQVAITYAGIPAPRPNLQTPAGLVEMLKPFLIPELLASEAARRGLAETPQFKNKLQQNKNALLRFYVQDSVERDANTRLRSSDLESQLRAWHDAHRRDYLVSSDNGTTRPASFAEARDRALADYSVALRDELLAEKAQQLRREHVVTIDEPTLAECHL